MRAPLEGSRRTHRKPATDARLPGITARARQARRAEEARPAPPTGRNRPLARAVANTPELAWRLCIWFRWRLTGAPQWCARDDGSRVGAVQREAPAHLVGECCRGTRVRVLAWSQISRCARA